MTVTIGLYFLFSGMAPTADVEAHYENRPGTVRIASWKPGDARLLKVKGKPVTIWRRDLAEMASAMAQFDPSVPLEEWSGLLESGSLKQELGPEVFARLEWFIVSLISTAGLGCIILAKTGNYAGFFDPCAGVHYDMWGRPQKGPTNEILVVPPHRTNVEGQFVVIDTSRLPAPK
ncbi:Ubiquinol-cytochrome c reductase iron-sulfur subunit [Ruegeria denitrificans]|uniref:Ubiquinol-cytochrome c reductase iron-sulfur subunit n=2 Tax=Ruegeria denitrificans TaxID=1715692 RepID=A0A0N7M8M1_9RHOB|nr:Ubiquinol-cytochrome c reductase iron-sulfur subunit [Ruegeria denitrificans]